MSPDNFWASGSILTKVFPDDVPRVNGNKMCTNFGRPAPYNLGGRKKTSKIPRDFWQPSTLIANIPETAVRLKVSQIRQESSPKLTNQRFSYAFNTSSPFSFHARHILPTSKFQHGYSCILLIFSGISEQHEWKLWDWVQNCKYSSLVWRFLFAYSIE